MTRLFLAVALCLLLSATASAVTIRVPTDANSIHLAADLASPGDTVLVAPGTYLDRVTIISKNIVLRGESGDARDAVIDGSVSTGNVLTLANVSRSMIVEDLTITGGTFNAAAQESVGTAIYVNQGSPTIRRCRMIGNDANVGGGMAAYFFSSPRMEDCWISNNEGGGVFVETGDGEPGGPSAEIVNTTIVRNQGFGVSVIKGASTIVERCTIAFNTGDGIRSERGNPDVTVRNTLVTDNAGAGIRRLDNGVCFVLSCNDVINNVNGEWVGTNPNDPCFSGRGTGSVSIDPMYTNPLGDDYTLRENSPLFSLCTEGGCGALGANNQCVAVSQTTWGRLKEIYRE